MCNTQTERARANRGHFLIAHAQQLDILDLMDHATLLNASTALFPPLFSELAQVLFMTTPPPSASPLAGMVQNPTWQLVARPTSIQIVQAAMSVLLGVVVAVYFLRPVTSLPMNPSSMAAQVILIASNHDNISRIIKDTITQTNADTHALLKHYWFWIETRGKFRITAERRGIDSLLLLGLIVAGTIIGLEVGLRKSQRNVGFADFLPLTQDWWTYAAPSYLFVLGVISSYVFSVSTLEPFFCNAPVSAASAEVGQIAVSGLITVTSQPAERVAFLAATTVFNTTSPLGSEEFINIPKQILALSQIQKYQLPLPVWSTSEGAIAQVDTTCLIPLTRTPNTTVTIPLNVMRADLGNCSTVDVPTDILQSQWGIGLSDLTLPTSPGWFSRVYSFIWTSSNSTLEPSDGYTFIYGTTQPTNASEIQEATVVQCLLYTVSVATQNVTLAYENNTVQILSLGSAPKTGSVPIQNISYQSDPDPVTTLQESGILVTPMYETNSSLLFDTLFQIMTLGDPLTSLEVFLEPEMLTKAAQALFTMYGAITTSISQRIPIPDASQKFIPATVNYQKTRIVQAEAPTRILQVLLSCVLAFGLVTGLLVHQTNDVLTKSPYPIGATMGLLANSAFVELKDLKTIRNEAELDRVLEPYEFQLGWGNNPKGARRFGVDIVWK
ncbi:hypothetical protein B0H14DRAFT_3616021 [Mycena olivaceomarginata]|nr:hypothetical protein B0H14DRAFT_3616021 [Mycena olivaceomarginata]